VNPIDFPEANRTFGKPAGMTDEECQPLRVHDSGEGYISCWRPTDEERAAVAAGGPVWLCVVGRGHPPVWLDGRPNIFQGGPPPVDAPPDRPTRYALTREREEAIQKAFTHHPPAGDQPSRYQALRQDALFLALTIAQLTPPGREQDLALANLEQAVMWANRAIACGESR
jgi:hypothetical protein